MANWDIGDDVTDLMSGPKIGEDVTNLFNTPNKPPSIGVPASLEPAPSYNNKSPLASTFQQEKPDFFGTIGRNIGTFLEQHPKTRDFLGRAADVNYGRDPNAPKIIGQPTSESVLPEWKSQPETYAGGFTRSIYNDLRGLVSPAGVVENAVPENMAPFGKRPTAVVPEVVPPAKPQLALPPAPDWALNPETVSRNPRVDKLPTINVQHHPPVNPATMVAGPEGIVPANRNIETALGTKVPAPVAARYGDTIGAGRPGEPLASVANIDELREAKRLQDLKYTQAEHAPGSSMNVPDKPLSMPPENGDPRLGFQSQTRPGQNPSAGFNFDALPDRLRPRAVQTDIAQRVPEAISPVADVPKASDISFSSVGKELEGNLPDPFETELARKKASAPELGTAPRSLAEQKAAETGIAAEAPDLPSAVKEPRVKAKTPVPETTKKISTETGYRAISEDATPKEGVGQWAYGQEGARVRGQVVRDKFKDLTPDLIDKFEAGDRSTPELKKIATFFEDWQKKLSEIGILKEDQKRLNYIRHIYEGGEEAQSAAVKEVISKNPKFAKEGTFKTYKQAEELTKGNATELTRKFQNPADIMAQYETEAQKAIRNKELYDWLEKTGQIKKGSLAKTPDNWIFKGENAKEIAQLIKNVTTDSPTKLNWLANVSSKAKNLYLSSGIPKTILNKHGWNTAWTDAEYRGHGKALENFFNGVFRPAKDTATIAKHTESGLLQDLVDRGMTWQNFGEADVAKAGAKSDTLLGKAKDVVDKGFDWQKRIFEDPLFQRHLPAMKLDAAAEKVAQLTPKIGRDAALKQAAKEVNEFYGGINKVLRDKTYNDLARMGILAPDWAEARARVGVKGLASLAGKADPVYGKALGRNLARRAVVMGGTAATTGSLLNPSKRATNTNAMPIGKTSTGLNRELPLQSPSDLPVMIEQVMAGRDAGGEIAKSRIALPAKSLYNALFNEDDFGNPLRGKDKYDRPIPKTRGFINTASQLAAPVRPPWADALYRLIVLGKDPEQAIAGGLEAPYNVNSEPNAGRNKLRLK